jgi:hypothetical protein
MYTILGLIETPGQWQELIRLAKLLRSSRPVTQLFLVYDCEQATAEVIAGINQIGAQCINAGGPAENDTRGRVLSATPSMLRLLLRFVRDIFRAPLLLLAYRKLLRRRKVSLVVVTEDNVAGRSRALVAAASRAGVPVLLLPFTIPNPYEAAWILGRRRHYQVRGWFTRLFAALRPNWVLTTATARLLRLPLMQALIIELTRLAPARPWIDNEGPATIAVESRAMMKHYSAMGFSDRQLVLTGSLVDEVLEASSRDRAHRQAELRRRFTLNDRPLLLCALPPDQLTNAGAVGEFSEYGALIEAWTAALAAVARKFAVLVRPHPRITATMLDPLRRAGIAICWDDTATLVPLCDLYVASISATIRWAIACGRPVVNYDVFQYRFNDYEGVPGIITVNDLAAFNKALGGLADAPERLAAMTSAQSAIAADWGWLDGQSSGRILALADRLLAGINRTA